MNRIQILAVVGLIMIGIHSVRVIDASGMLLSLKPIELEQCEASTGLVGAEDITIDRKNRVAYISVDDARLFQSGVDIDLIENGGIWLLDLKQPNSLPVKVELDIAGPFHPHGFSMLYEGDKAVELYVINHLDLVTHEIDIFTLGESGKLTLRRRVTYPELIAPNDIVAIGKDQFFVTNDHSSDDSWLMRALEDYLGIPWSSVSYFDGQQGHLVIDDLRYPNGVAISDDQTTLYVAETTARRISRFVKGETSLDWELQDRINLDMAPDNIEWDGHGSLLVAGHPKLFDFMTHKKDPEVISPSEVIRIDVAHNPVNYETLYRNFGEGISGSSVAAQLDKTLLIGSVLEHSLRCSTNTK
ncbi:MAG: SMP-30/gluconolactonase/LRE family protein [Bermanella sp.]